MDRTFTIYRRHFALFAGIMCLPMVPMAMCHLAVLMVQPSDPSAIGTQSDPVAALAGIVPLFAISLVSIVVSILLYGIAAAAMTVAISRIYLGRSVSIRDAYAAIQSRIAGVIGLEALVLLIYFGSFVALGLATGLGVLAGALVHPILGAMAAALLFLSGVVALVLLLAGRFSIAVPALVLEDLPPAKAIGRSNALTRGHRVRVVLIYVLMMVITYVGALIFQGPFLILGLVLRENGQPPLWTQLLGAISGSIGGVLTGPLLCITLALLYYDIRIKKEGFDLQLMMRGLETRGSSYEAAAP
jgi:hypothetical protein